MSETSQVTTDHNEIRQWVEEHGGKPTVVDTDNNEDGGILRIDFPGYSGEGSLREISWDEFFEIFDDRGLQFLYQKKTTDGEESRFNKFIRG